MRADRRRPAHGHADGRRPSRHAGRTDHDLRPAGRQLRGAAYTFTEVYLNTSGAWTVKTGGYTGTCHEWNGNASVPVSPTRYVQLRWFGEVDEWRFQSGAC